MHRAAHKFVSRLFVVYIFGYGRGWDVNSARIEKY